MRASKMIFVMAGASALLAASISSADARGYYRRGPGPVLGLVGGVIVGAATIATLPLRIVGDVLLPGSYPSDYYSGGYGYYGPPQPPYGDGYGYNYGDGGNYGPPPPRYSNYAPPPGYYGYGY